MGSSLPTPPSRHVPGLLSPMGDTDVQENPARSSEGTRETRVKEQTFERDSDPQKWRDELAEQRPSSRRGPGTSGTHATQGCWAVGSRGGVSRAEVEKGSWHQIMGPLDFVL